MTEESCRSGGSYLRCNSRKSEIDVWNLDFYRTVTHGLPVGFHIRIFGYHLHPNLGGLRTFLHGLYVIGFFKIFAFSKKS